MNRRIIKAIASFSLLAGLGAACPVRAQNSQTPYPKMAPLDQYLMERNAEIVLARSAAPESISRDAEVLVLGRHGYETAVRGKNGLVCEVERSWTKPIDDPNFWNPRARGPLCLNPAGAQSYLPILIKKTELILAGELKTQMADAIKAAFDKKELPKLQPGAMCYMLSRQQDTDGDGKHWHPHVMFLIPESAPVTWGENMTGSPIVAAPDTLDRMTVLMVLVRKWSDGAVDSSS
jgi:hypothetical protein